jgi:hypothetical protein
MSNVLFLRNEKCAKGTFSMANFKAWRQDEAQLYLPVTISPR